MCHFSRTAIETFRFRKKISGRISPRRAGGSLKRGELSLPNYPKFFFISTVFTMFSLFWNQTEFRSVFQDRRKIVDKTSKVHWIRNPLRRKSEHNHKYNYLNF